MIGKTIFHYKIIEKLGWGGMGVVFKAKDLKLGRFVALKFLPPAFNLDEEAKQRFIHEAKSASSLQHHNICTIHEINNTEDGQLFICMDYYEGETLRERINSETLSIDEINEISIKILEGLSAAHEKGITHRDIKPENIFITKKNEVKILDFGLAKSSTYSKITRSDRTSGTISYISPEQAQGKEATQLSDIWSLGVVMYEMLTSQLPFKGGYDQVIIYSILDKEPERITVLNPGIPQELEQIVIKALNKDVESRYQSVDEMLSDLQNFENESALLDNTHSIVERSKNNKRVKFTIVSILVITFAILAFYFIRPLLLGVEKENIPVTLAVVGFENQTGDSTYNYLQKAIPNLLITNLEQAEQLRVITWERMHDLLRQTLKEKIEFINKDLGFELSEQADIDAIVVGSFVKAGDVFATDVKVLDAKTKKLLKSANIKSNGLASILNNQIDFLSEEVIKGIGLTAKDIESVKLRIADVSTTSIEAYKNYLKGKEEFDKFYLEGALKYFERAVQIDSTFAAAHLYVGLTQYYLFEITRRNEAYSKAEKFKESATDREKIYIESFYWWAIKDDKEKSINILKQGLKKYPKEKTMHQWLGIIYNEANKYSKALEEFNKIPALDPEYGIIYNYIGHTYAFMGDYEKALENIKKYVSYYPEDAGSYSALGTIFFKLGLVDEAIIQFKKAFEMKNNFGAQLPTLFLLKEDYSEAVKWQDKILNTRSTESLKYASMWWKCFSLYWTGNIKEALSLMEKIVEQDELVEDIWIARVSWLKGWIYYDKGRFDESQKYFKSYSEYRIKRRSDKAYNTAKKFLFLGLTNLGNGNLDLVRNNFKSINSAKNDLSKPLAHIITYQQNLLYGMLLIKEDSLDKAEKVLKNNPHIEIEPYYVTSWQIISVHFAPLLQDGLALIYLNKGELNKAVEVYEELISHENEFRGQLLIHPKYHYRLAILYEKKGEKNKAIRELKKFLEIWQNADKDLPELIDAKKRLEGLRMN